MSTGARQAGESAARRWAEARRRREAVESESAPRPLLRPAPRSAMFVPLVVVAAVLPGLYALNWWDLVPPGPWWGLRGLAVLDGWRLDQVSVGRVGPAHEAAAYRAVALQPPLYAWLEAIFLWLSPSLNPLATVLPSYVAGVLVVMLVFLHGRLWRGPGLGVVAAVLMAFSRDLLVQMQQASPATLGVAGLLGALLAYGQALRADDGRARGWLVVAGGLCLGLSLLAVGLFGLLGVVIVAAHQAILACAAIAHRRSRRRMRLTDFAPLAAGVVTLAIALAIAVPWHLHMLSRYGLEFARALVVPPRPSWGSDRDLLVALLALAPASLPLTTLAIGRGIREALRAERHDPSAVGGSFWLAWLAIAGVAMVLWRSGPRPALTLLLLVPLNLLAARAMTDLAARRLPARWLVWLAPATALSIAGWLSSGLRGAVLHLARGHRPGAAALLGLGLIVMLVLATRRLDRWARRHDDRRRAVLAGFLLTALAVTAGAGLREVRFRHVETAELLELRSEVLRRSRLKPLTVLAVVSPEAAVPPAAAMPGGRLRFVLRTALPRLAQLDYRTTDKLLSLPNPPGAQRLVVLVGMESGLPYRVQSQLGLEAIHAGRSGTLDAFATTYVPPPRRRR